MDSSSSQKEVQYIWHSPLLQAIGTLRGAGQIYCATECQKLWETLHSYDPSERSEVKIVERMLREISTSES